MLNESSNMSPVEAPKTEQGTYVFDTAQQYGKTRYRLLSEMFDGNTTRHLRSLAICAGWQCLEAGAGAGSIAHWMSKRVGPQGMVIATELDVSLLQKRQLANLRVLRHDLVRDPLPERRFNLVHLRLVLMHLPQREQVLTKLCAAVKPGGWIMLEEFDSLSQRPKPRPNSDERPLKTAEAFGQYMASKGVDLGYGSLLTSALLNRGFVNLRSEGKLSLWQGGSSGSRFVKSTFEELREPLLGTGMIRETDYLHDLVQLDNPEFLCASPVMWTVCGQRPI